jgi:hypothetical protein
MIDSRYQNIVDKIDGVLDDYLPDIQIITLTDGLCEMELPIRNQSGTVGADVYHIASDLAAITASSTLCDIIQHPKTNTTHICIMSNKAVKPLRISAKAVKSSIVGMINCTVDITDNCEKLVSKAMLTYQIVNE